MCCSALFSNLEALGKGALCHVRSVAVDGTSATALLLDRRSGKLVASPKLYNEPQPDDAVTAVKVRPFPAVATRECVDAVKLVPPAPHWQRRNSVQRH